MPLLPYLTTGVVVDDSDWNAIITDINSLTGKIAITLNNGVAVYESIAPASSKTQLSVYGLGQTTAAWADSGNGGGSLYLEDQGQTAGNGGAVLFGAFTKHFAAVKSLISNAASNGIGDLAISLRANLADTAFSEVMRCHHTGTIGTVGIGSTAPTYPLHVRGANQTVTGLTDSGVRGGAICVQDSATSAGNGGAIYFGAGSAHFAALKGSMFDASSNSTGTLAISTRKLPGDTALSEVCRFVQTGAVYIGEVLNTTMTVGLTINQGQNDDEALTLRSSDVSHSFTAVSGAATYATFLKNDGGNGGLRLRGFSDSGAAEAIALEGFAGTSNTGKATSALGAVTVSGLISDGGTNGTTMGANANIFVVRSGTAARFILDADGDSHQDVGTAWTNFDDYDDVSLLTAISAAVSKDDDPLRRTFGRLLEQSRPSLEGSRIVSFGEDGHNFVNWSRLSMLLVGAVRQLGGQVDALETRLKELSA